MAVQRQAVEVAGEIGLAVEVLGQAPLPHRGEIQRVEQRREQRHVAHADLGCGEPVMGGRLEAEGERLGIGRRLVGAPEQLDAGLQELARLLAALAEHRAEIAEARRAPGRGRRDVVARHRNGEVRAQAELAARLVGDQIHAPADVLAGQVEKGLGRLQDRRRHARVSGALVGSDERVRAGVGGDGLGHGSRRLMRVRVLRA